jgi:hypothetical protein
MMPSLLAPSEVAILCQKLGAFQGGRSGLKQRINALTELAEEQRKTLETVRSRAEEYEKLSSGYKKAVSDYHEMGSKLDEKRNQLVKELEAANEQKDQELIRLKQGQLEEIDQKKESLKKISELERTLTDAVAELNKNIRMLLPAETLSLLQEFLSHSLSIHAREKSDLLLTSHDFVLPMSLSMPDPYFDPSRPLIISYATPSDFGLLNEAAAEDELRGKEKPPVPEEEPGESTEDNAEGGEPL